VVPWRSPRLDRKSSDPPVGGMRGRRGAPQSPSRAGADQHEQREHDRQQARHHHPARHRRPAQLPVRGQERGQGDPPREHRGAAPHPAAHVPAADRRGAEGQGHGGPQPLRVHVVRRLHRLAPRGEAAAGHGAGGRGGGQGGAHRHQVQQAALAAARPPRLRAGRPPRGLRHHLLHQGLVGRAVPAPTPARGWGRSRFRVENHFQGGDDAAALRVRVRRAVRSGCVLHRWFADHPAARGGWIPRGGGHGLDRLRGHPPRHLRQVSPFEAGSHRGIRPHSYIG